LEEWLFESGITVEDKLIFKREAGKNGKPSITMADKYLKSKKSELLIELLEDNLLKNNETLLSKYESLKNDEINSVLVWFNYNLLLIFPQTHFEGLVPRLDTYDMDLSKYFGEDEEVLKNEIIEELKSKKTVELNSEDGIVIATKEKGKYIVKIVVCKHLDNKGELVNFEINEESDGTQRLLDFIPACEEIITRDSTVLIDEIDQSLHPVLLHSLLEKIMADTTTKGQLIFTTHESNLLSLDIFRQDEIWFAEKSKDNGSTQLYSLNDFKPRFDLDIRKGYLKGRFGAIPFLADLETLNWNKSNA
jgi:AAA15 family ATPase/GTPase